MGYTRKPHLGLHKREYANNDSLGPNGLSKEGRKKKNLFLELVLPLIKAEDFIFFHPPMGGGD